MIVESAPTVALTESELGLADRLQPLFLIAAICTGLLIGRATPGIAEVASNLVSVGVFVLIALVMVNINPRNVAGMFTHRRFLLSAIGLNFLVNPIIVWILGSVFLAEQPHLRIGLILFLVTPCIGWYLIFTELAGGDTELGVGLLGLNVVLQVLLLPVYLELLVGDAATIELRSVVRSIGLYLLGPAMVAGLIRHWWSRQGHVAAIEQERLHISMLKLVTLATVIISMFATQADAIFAELGAVARLVVPMVLFFALAYTIAIVTAGRIGLPHDQTALLVFTTTSRNSEASLAIAATAFANPLVALTVALGPVIELPLLILMTRLLRRRAVQ